MSQLPIPQDVALALCRQIQARNRGRWYTPGGLMCWGCRLFTGGDPRKLCFSSRADGRGCFQVSAHFDRRRAF